jgi:hypothetical protein
MSVSWVEPTGNWARIIAVPDDDQRHLLTTYRPTSQMATCFRGENAQAIPGQG